MRNTLKHKHNEYRMKITMYSYPYILQRIIQVLHHEVYKMCQIITVKLNGFRLSDCRLHAQSWCAPARISAVREVASSVCLFKRLMKAVLHIQVIPPNYMSQ